MSILAIQKRKVPHYLDETYEPVVHIGLFLACTAYNGLASASAILCLNASDDPTFFFWL